MMARASGALGREADNPELLRAVLPALVNGTKEKNSYVRANAESSLRTLLRLHSEPDYFQVQIIHQFHWLEVHVLRLLHVNCIKKHMSSTSYLK